MSGGRVLAGWCLWLVACSTPAPANDTDAGLEAFARHEAQSLAGRAERFHQAAAQLTAALTDHCAASTGATGNAADVKTRWIAAASAWDSLAALGVGPLIERRSARHIDFMPVRPEMLARAIAAAPKTAADLERIGAPARGFPALEWLLWSQPVPAPQTSACDYAQLLGADIEREAQALDAAARQRAGAPMSKELAQAVLVETLNQWIGGVDQLGWAFMRKPLAVAGTQRGKDAGDVEPEFPRRASGQTATVWASRWGALRETADALETLLRARGQGALADQLGQTTAAAERALKGLRPEDVPRVFDAAQAVTGLTSLTQEKLAPALGVNMGFSDSDGD